jgi:hypothetical protein
MATISKEQLAKDDHDLLTKLKDRFQSSHNHDAWKAWRKEAEKCFDYRDGDQWTAADLKIIRKRRQPETVNNQVKVLTDHVMGQYLLNRTRSLYRGRNTPADDMSHHTLSALKLFIEQNQGYMFEERDMVDDAVVSGFGCLDIRPYYNEETKKVEISIEWRDNFNIYPDPLSRKYDWNKDARHISHGKWVDLPEVQSKFPDKKMQLAALAPHTADSISGFEQTVDLKARDQFIWLDPKRKRLFIVEQWWTQVETLKFIQLIDGRQGEVTEFKESRIKRILKENKGSHLFTETKKVLHMATFTDGLLLEKKRDPHRGITMYPFVPLFILRKKNGQPYGVVSPVRSMQDAVNKRESKSLHLLSTNQTITTKNNVENFAEHAEEKAKPDGNIVVKKMDEFLLNKNVDLAITQMNFHQAAKIAMREISGINPEALGERSEVRSGIGIAKKQGATQVIVSPIFDNLRRTKLIEGKLILAYIRKYFTGPMVFRITDDPQMGDFADKTFVINRFDERNGSIENDVTQYAYDVVVDEVPNTASMHQLQAQTLLQALPALSNLNPAFAMVAIQALDLKDKPKLMAILQQALQAQSQEAIPKASVTASWDNLNELEKREVGPKVGLRPKEPEIPEQQITRGLP